MNVLYTADLHAGHRNIIGLCDRPFADLEEMHRELVERWNAVVTEHDTVWVLGDYSLSPRYLYLLPELPGEKILVAGNHDPCWYVYRRWERMREVYLQAGFTAVHTSGHVRGHTFADGTLVNLAHLPYAGDSQAEDRHVEHRLADDGRPLVCGHVHNAWRVRGRQFNVGVDVWNYTPVPEEVLSSLVNQAESSNEQNRDPVD